MTEVWEAAGGVKVVELNEEVVKPVRSFLLPTGENYVLVDTGYKETADQLIQIIEKHSVRRIVLTHLHTDHAGGAAVIKLRKKIPVLYHEDELKTLRFAWQAGEWLPKVFEVGDLVAFHQSLSLLRMLPEPDGFVLNDSSLDGWKIFHTPGHTPGHIILTNKEIALTGDTILMDDTPNVAYVPLTGYRPLSNFLKSLVKIANLKPNLYIPSHGSLFQDCGKRVAEIYDHHYERLSQIARALERGFSSVAEIAEHVRWSRGSFTSLPPMEKWLAILETISHLDFLAESGYAVSKSVFSYNISERADWSLVKQELTKIAAGYWNK